MGPRHATEIGRAGIAFARDELDAAEVVAFTEPHNRASRAVMEKLGMTYVREFRRVEPAGEESVFALYTSGRLYSCA